MALTQLVSHSGRVQMTHLCLVVRLPITIRLVTLTFSAPGKGGGQRKSFYSQFFPVID